MIKKGGNAVYNYRQSVDHESGGENKDKTRVRILVVRAYGTAVSITNLTQV